MRCAKEVFMLEYEYASLAFLCIHALQLFSGVILYMRFNCIDNCVMIILQVRSERLQAYHAKSR